MVREILGVVLVSCSLSCGQDDGSPVACPAYAAAGLSVEVTNAATAQQICDATVTASQRSYSERLFVTSCSFVERTSGRARTSSPRREPVSFRRK